MNWKILGNAVLLASCLFVLVTLILLIGHLCPVLLLVISFVLIVALIYKAMKESGDDKLFW